MKGLMRALRFGAVLAGSLLASAGARAATVSVNAGDDAIHSNPSGQNCSNTGTGTCTLRDAILYINDEGGNGPHIINFTVDTVTLSNANPEYPPITDTGVTIDGTTAPSGRLTISGAAMIGSPTGLSMNGPTCVLKSLVVNGFGGDGIEIQPGGAGCQIMDSYIGTDVTGTSDVGNGDFGIVVNAPGVALTNNVISGNGDSGVQVIGTTTLATVFTNNKIGTDVSGLNDLGNDDDGVILFSGPDGTLFTGGNVISGNGRHGIFVNGNVESTGLVVTGNFIGTSIGGLTGIANDQHGVYFSGNVTLSAVGPGNVISGNGEHGVYLSGVSVDNNAVFGNIVGLDIGGVIGVGNGGDGIRLENARNNLVGLPLPPDPSILRNIVGSNGGAGIRINGSGNVFGNVVKGNYVGTDLTQSLSLPNGVGIAVEGGSTFDIDIGGDTDEEGNVVANNTGAGIVLGGPIVGDPGPVRILRNVIYANGGLGIDLGNDGVTPNDPNDADIGANDNQNAPAFTKALVSPVTGQVVLRGTQVSRPAIATRLQFFRAEADPSGSGEGRALIQDVVNAGTGTFSFGGGGATPAVAVLPGQAVTATATTVDGTSEFSANAVFTVNQLPVANAGPDQTAGTGALVTLDGSASSDPDGEPDAVAIQNGRYAWGQTAGPAVSLTGGTGAAPSFTPAAAGIYTFALVVNDGLDNSTNPESVTITVSEFGALQFSSATYSANEAAGSTNLTVNRVGGSFGAVSIDYAVTGGTATAGSDFVLAAGTLNWADGDNAPKTIPVGSLDDVAPAEPDETVVVTLSNPGGSATLGAPVVATLTIVDNDLPGSLQFDQAASTVNEAAGSATLTVTRTGGTFGAVSADFGVTGGTATAGSDFLLAGGTLSWADGDAAPKTITVSAIDDVTPAEPDETVIVTLSNPTGSAALGAPAATTLTIVDDDVPGTLQFASATYNANEGDGTASLVVTRTGGSFGAVSADYAVTGGTATAASDFTLAGGTVSWADGDVAPKNVTVTLLDDVTAAEPNETVEVTLANPTGSASLGPVTVTTLTIADNDVPGSVQFAAAAVSANEGDGTATLTVTRTGGSDGAVSIDYAVTGGTATAGGDFNLAGGTLDWANGDAAPKTIVVTVIDDPVVGEPDETVIVTLSNPGGGVLQGAPAAATLTIVDNDIPQFGSVRFAATDYSAGEGDGITTLFVERVGGSDGAVSVEYLVIGGTATAGSDFALPAGTLAWADGDAASKTITVTLLDDPVAGEPDETVGVNLTNPTGGAAIGNPGATVLTIVDNDPTGTLAFDSATYAVGESGGSATITVTRTGGSSGIVSIDYLTTDGTATLADADYAAASGTLNWAAGDAAPKTFTVTINDDPDTEGGETVNLTLQNPGGNAGLGLAAAVLTLTDDDGTPADLAIVKSDGRTYANPGRSLTYTLTVTNPGTTAISGATVTDALPGALLAATWTCAAAGGGSCTPSGGGSIADTVNLPVGASLTYTLTATVDPSAAGLLANVASVALPASFGDVTPANNVSTDTDTLVTPGVKDDFDGDGRSDLILYNSATGQTDIWLMDGITIGTSGTAGVLAAPWTIAATGDLDGDLRADVLWYNGATGEVLVWFMNGITPSGTTTLGAFADLAWTIGAVGDFDANGRFDVAWRNGTTGEVYAWLIDAGAIAAQGTLGTSGGTLIRSGDFNRDGLWDLVTRGAGGATSVWLLNGLAVSSTSPTSATIADPNFQLVGTGDHDGDGDADVLWHNPVSGGKQTWLMNGASVATQGVPGGALRAHPEVGGAGDTNGDGRADITWQNLSTGRVYVWIMNGLTVTTHGVTGTLPGSGTVWKVVRTR